LGSIYDVYNVKSHIVSYSFTFYGKKYRGSERGGYGLLPGNIAVVYLDPKDPTTNSLTEFRLKSKKEHGIMIVRGCLSTGLAAFFAFVLWINSSKKKDALRGSKACP
jgi:hypothetical protein